MKALHPHDLGIAPLYLMDGLRPNLQVVLAWLWDAELTGEAWTMKWLGERTGMGGGTVKKALDELEVAGVVFPTNMKKSPYSVNVDFIPAREPAPKEEKKKAKRYPDWVFDAMKAWQEAKRGVLGPQEVHNSLHLAVSIRGEQVVMQAFREYAMNWRKGWHTVKKFAENMDACLPSAASRPTARPFGGE